MWTMISKLMVKPYHIFRYIGCARVQKYDINNQICFAKCFVFTGYNHNFSSKFN